MKKRNKPYDLNEVAKQRLHQRFSEGYVPEKGKPYDLSDSAKVREYYKWKSKK